MNDAVFLDHGLGTRKPASSNVVLRNRRDHHPVGSVTEMVSYASACSFDGGR